MLKHFFQSLIKILFKDIRWKLFSLGLAVMLWFVGMNVNNPVSIRSYSRILQLANVETLARDNVVILNERQLRARTIDVRVRATKSDLDLLGTPADNVVPSIDLRAVDTSEVLLSDKPVTVTVRVGADIILPGYELLNCYPFSVEVELDQYVKQTRTVQAIVVGEVAEGYERGQATPSHNVVTISGAKSLVDRVYTVRAEVNARDADSDFESVERLVAYDEDNVDITSTVTLSVTETNVHVFVQPHKQVKLEARYSGTPASGYTMTGVEIQPKNISIVGPVELLESITQLTLDSVSLNNVDETFTRSFDIRQVLPDPAVTLKDGEPTEVSVTFTIEPFLVKEFAFLPGEMRVTGYPAGYSMRFVNDEPAVIRVRGVESIMDNLTQDRITVTLNLYGLEPGIHSVPLTVALPSRQYTLVEDPPAVEVVIEATDGTGGDTDNSGAADSHDASGDDSTPDDNAPDANSDSDNNEVPDNGNDGT